MKCLNCEHLAQPGWALCDDCVPLVYGKSYLRPAERVVEVVSSEVSHGE